MKVPHTSSGKLTWNGGIPPFYPKIKVEKRKSSFQITPYLPTIMMIRYSVLVKANMQEISSSFKLEDVMITKLEIHCESKKVIYKVDLLCGHNHYLATSDQFGRNIALEEDNLKNRVWSYCNIL